MRKSLLGMIGTILVVVLCGGAPSLVASDPEPATSDSQTHGHWVLAGDADTGAILFARSCAACHGADGSGKGTVTISDVKMPDFRDRTTIKKQSYHQWYQVIRDGGGVHGMCTKMLPAGHRMDDQSIHDLVAFLRTLPAKAYVDRARSDG